MDDKQVNNFGENTSEVESQKISSFDFTLELLSIRRDYFFGFTLVPLVSFLSKANPWNYVLEEKCLRARYV